MAETPYITIKLAGENLDLPQSRELPIALNYEIEDDEDFRQKKSGTSLNITIPATTNNSEKLNTLFNPGSEDLLPDEGFNKPMDVVIVGAGNELMTGKAFLLAGRKQNGKPLNFDIDIFGDNADWVIPNKELTLHDVVSALTHPFDKTTIENSWAHDGTNETEDYVYAPARYRQPFGLDGDPVDEIVRVENLKPALFLYWLLFRGFKKAGYKVSSNFLDSDYFRRMVLPWTWDEFLFIKVEKLMCRAARPNGISLTLNGTSPNGTIAAGVSDDTALGNFDNGVPLSPPVGCYNYDPIGKSMNWFYLSGILPALGTITGSFSCRVNSSWQIGPPFITVTVTINWFINASLIQSDIVWSHTSGGIVGAFGALDAVMTFVAPNLVVGDTVSATISMDWGGAGSGTTVDFAEIVFYTNYFRAQNGTIIDLKSHLALKKWKWLDLLRGTIDAFNLQLNTDSVTKTVTLEPTHDYALDNNLGDPSNPGFYRNVVEWTQKEDISKVSTITRFQDYEKEVTVKMRDDANDGMLKLVQDRHKLNLTESKYIFPERFKKGAKVFENRFFSGVVHCEAAWWSKITGIRTQLVTLIPENISQTSETESQSSLGPKLLYYKGLCDKAIVGGWNWDGDESFDYPFMFAVNYKVGGENDPVLTYCDQRIPDGTNGFILAKGLFKRFFWQRFAIMRHGKKYEAYFKVNTSDVLNVLHREFKAIQSQRYQLIKIEGFKPLINETTKCILWKWYPVTQEDADNTFPSSASVIDQTPIPNSFDLKYEPCMCLQGDIIRFQ